MKYQVGLSIFLLFLIRTGKSSKYTLVNDFNVAASADEVWAVYSSHNLTKLIVKLLPGMFKRIDVLKGDGGVGTILRLVYPPGSVPLTYKEKFVTIDNRRRLKEVLQIEGGYLEMGVTFYMDSFQVIKRGRDSCIVRSITKYEIRDNLAVKVSPLISVDSLVTMARAISKYVLENKKKANSTIFP
ncbi:S-norcoclaurine synthase-like [Papaver somniferum]|nr:S-norcoclaurine synthase-like [Papaver somniferum]